MSHKDPEEQIVFICSLDIRHSPLTCSYAFDYDEEHDIICLFQEKCKHQKMTNTILGGYSYESYIR